jgi:hypothetical protein
VIAILDFKSKPNCPPGTKSRKLRMLLLRRLHKISTMTLHPRLHAVTLRAILKQNSRHKSMQPAKLLESQLRKSCRGASSSTGPLCTSYRTTARRMTPSFSAHPNDTVDYCRDTFGPMHFYEAIILSKRVSKAEKAMKAARVEARKAEVEQPNSYDQESNFLTAAGEGEPIIKQHAQFSMDTCNTKRIREWPTFKESMLRLSGEADHVLVFWCNFLNLSSTSYLSYIVDTSCKQTLRLALSEACTTEQYNTFFSLHFPHCNKASTRLTSFISLSLGLRWSHGKAVRLVAMQASGKRSIRRIRRGSLQFLTEQATTAAPARGQHMIRRRRKLVNSLGKKGS